MEVQRLRLDPGEGESGPLLRFYLNESSTQPIDLPIRSLVDAAFEVLQVSRLTFCIRYTDFRNVAYIFALYRKGILNVEAVS